MYVGPWQEYAIARSRVKNETKSKLTNRFKEDLEAAMINSLDPVSAARALKAMEKVMRKSEVPFAIDDASLTGAAKKRRPPKIMAGEHNLAPYRLQLPSVAQQGSLNDSGALSERERDQSTPSSVRTSASEPLQGQARSGHLLSPRVKARQTQELTQQHYHHDSFGDEAPHAPLQQQGYRTLADHVRHIPNVPDSLPSVAQNAGLGAVSPEAARRHEQNKKWGPQPPYNSSAAVTALRLAKAGSKAKPMLTYSGYWEWSKHNKGDGAGLAGERTSTQESMMTDRLGSSEEEAAAGTVRRNNNNNNGSSSKQGAGGDAIIDKVERVKRMQQMYSQKGGVPQQQPWDPTGGLDHSVAQSTAPPTPLLTQYQHFDAPVHGNDSPLVRQHQASSAVKPKTPVVGEMDLTDHELMMISKYFPDQLQQLQQQQQQQEEDLSVHGMYDEVGEVGEEGEEEDNEGGIHFPIPTAAHRQEQGMDDTGYDVPPADAAAAAGESQVSTTGRESPVEGLGETPIQMSPVGIGVRIVTKSRTDAAAAIALSPSPSKEKLVIEQLQPGSASASAYQGGMGDDLFGGGGADNLLDWSAGLDVDSL
jgi:hypothetical protein